MIRIPLVKGLRGPTAISTGRMKCLNSMCYLRVVTQPSTGISDASTMSSAPLTSQRTWIHLGGRSAAMPKGGYLCDPALWNAKRSFLNFGGKEETIKVDPRSFDKETIHYSGKIFGFDADAFIFYAKVAGGVAVILFGLKFFLKGYFFLSQFSLQNVARIGFFGGFITCFIGYTTVLTISRRFAINANAVYNQSIALVMRHERVIQLLGTHPKTGEFKTYAESGGFKLPLLRRLRSGSYELADLLALKPRRLQMLFQLKNAATGYEGLVACDVRKESTGLFSSTNVYKSLSITLTDTSKVNNPETIVLIGRPEDVVYYNMLH